MTRFEIEVIYDDPFGMMEKKRIREKERKRGEEEEEVEVEVEASQ